MAKKYRFVMNGNNVLYTLQGTRTEIIRDAMGSPIATKRIPPLQLTIENGVGGTDDEKVAQLIQEHRDWGRIITWHPTCVPKDSPPEVRETSEKISEGTKARFEAKRKGILAAREGSIPKEE